MAKRVSRREFLKSIGLLALSLPVVSFIVLHTKKKQYIRPREASFYRRLAG